MICFRICHRRIGAIALLDPPIPALEEGHDTDYPGCELRSGPYSVTVTVDEYNSVGTATLRIARSDDRPVRVRRIEFVERSTPAGRYFPWTTKRLQARQGAFTDLPWNLSEDVGAQSGDPLLLWLDGQGLNRLSFGFLDTSREARLRFAMVAGHAPGHISKLFETRLSRWQEPLEPLECDYLCEGLYVSVFREPWHAALARYAKCVDRYRGFSPVPRPSWALEPMWHSWYAFEDRLREDILRRQAELAAGIGFGSFQVDAGWNTSGRGAWFAEEGRYEPHERFADFPKFLADIKGLGLHPVLHWSPFVLGKQAPNRAELAGALMKGPSVRGDGDILCPRTPRTRRHVLESARRMVEVLGADGLWADFVDAVPPFAPCKANHEHVTPSSSLAIDDILREIAVAVRSANPQAALYLRRSYANLNNKAYATFLWPSDAPFDHPMNRREVMMLRCLASGVLTHACCTCWAPDEEDAEVARHMASVVLAGVPSVSVDMSALPKSHAEIMRAWLRFYRSEAGALVCGTTTPLTFPDPAAALSVASGEVLFAGFFTIVPGAVVAEEVPKRIVVVNATREFRLRTSVLNVQGKFRCRVLDLGLNLVCEREASAKDDELSIVADARPPFVLEYQRI